MRLLLDTNVLLLLALSPERVPRGVRAILSDPGTSRLASAVSYAEIAIKVSLGRISVPGGDVGGFMRRAERDMLLEHLPLTHSHALGLLELPMHHRDPFDRLLVAQSIHERCPLVTSDRELVAYPIDVIW